MCCKHVCADVKEGEGGLIFPSVLPFSGDAGVSQLDVPPAVGVINCVGVLAQVLFSIGGEHVCLTIV